MKPPIIYILIFLMAFLIVTVSIIFFNSQFTNMFKFDFSSREKKIEKIEAVALPQNEILPAITPVNLAINTDTSAQSLTTTGIRN
ncbi:MAG: hypothetical protein C0425_11655, partial [Chlorobiaceae bacterium]|nr:hypothetical protein [Chlorobiaceae bacterium]